MIRLVATDVDGTLLDHHGSLSPERAEAARALVASGVPLVLATGKLWTSVHGLVTSLELPGPHVACNGSVVFAADGTLLVRHLLDDAVADEVAARLRRDRIPHAIYLEDGSIVTAEVVPAHDVLPVLGEPEPVATGRDGRGVIKVLAILPPDQEGDLRRVGADAARVQRTGPRFLEWNALGADKATGLTTVAGLLGIDLAEVVAIGDAENDVPMLRCAGIGLAVTDASPAAVEAADHRLDADLALLLGSIATSGRIAPELLAADRDRGPDGALTVPA